MFIFTFFFNITTILYVFFLLFFFLIDLDDHNFKLSISDIILFKNIVKQGDLDCAREITAPLNYFWENQVEQLFVFINENFERGIILF